MMKKPVIIAFTLALAFSIASCTFMSIKISVTVENKSSKKIYISGAVSDTIEPSSAKSYEIIKGDCLEASFCSSGCAVQGDCFYADCTWPLYDTK